ncbi:transmembrane ATP-binding protein ABCtransporter [Mycobacterium tuberculosis CAS/NITR204]|uniref:Transmembrane ATP-binding protein ABCtransporter n=1 Tax=Mycobacterium tuberculosis CAS/NITR204 TaxID=1310114 RepID=R4MAA6_MYCTX|nr:transmembrane ATP-binding protein ABCtransporter [Mycobacterium tuberculosis CAS/NITR204]
MPSDRRSLSGGELQRLALAAALAREPAMLIADEVTTMVDQQGRDALLAVLSGLTQRHRTALVHITHYDNEADSADRTLSLSDSPDNTDMVHTAAMPAPVIGVDQPQHAPALELVGVGHEYASGTPWAKTALRDINFVVEQGDGVLIHGGNGSGKSTLAWIMAGLTIPTTGACLLDGRPTHEQVGAVALSFQAARLQLMRSRVDLEVASAAGFSASEQDRVAAALTVVGLDPALGARRIDQLSGGQMRRVVLAGLLARAPRALILDEPFGLTWAARPAAAAEAASGARPDGGRSFARLRGDGGALPAYPASARRCAGIGGGVGGGGNVMTTTSAPARNGTRRPSRPIVLLIPVPGSSVIHDLWAGTKLLVVFGISVLLTFYPGWVTIGMMAALVLAAARIAHIPRGALPSVPRWLWIVLAIGFLTAALAGGTPVVAVRSAARIGLRSDFRRHRAVGCAPGAGGDGVLDHQCCRNQPCGSHFGSAVSGVADPGRRMGGGVGARAARLPDVDRRIPGALRRAPAAAQADAAKPQGSAPAACAELIDLLPLPSR